jgi:predicted Zn-dependent protease
MSMLPLAGAVLLGWALLAASVQAAPAIPSSDDVVLERLPESRDASVATLKKMRALARAAPQDLRIATLYARRAIDASRASGDPRYLGQAQAALQPWWSADDAPSPALLLRATIRQSLHDFDGALADLDRLVARSPNDAQARLTRATVRNVVGRVDEARADCDRLEAAAPALVVAACRTSVDASTWRALDAALSSTPTSDAGVRVWALTIAGERAAQRGDVPAAESHFRNAFALDATDAYLAGAYADVLIDAGRHADAARLLEERTRHDALLLRLVIAEKRLPERHERYEADRAELAARFEATRRRGDTVHRREEARYALEVEGDATRALALARANYALQKEPADARLLAEAARAMGAPR